MRIETNFPQSAKALLLTIIAIAAPFLKSNAQSLVKTRNNGAIRDASSNSIAPRMVGNTIDPIHKTEIITESLNTSGRAKTALEIVTSGESYMSLISGAVVVCTGGTTTLSDTTSGGVWSSSNTSIATVNISGVVTGVAGGIATISYTTDSSGVPISATHPITVNSVSIPTLFGLSSVCAGSAVTLTSSVPGGTWSSSNPAVAVVAAPAIIEGITNGSTIISYTVSYSCGLVAGTMSLSVNVLLPTSPTINTMVGNGTMGYSGDGAPAVLGEVNDIGHLVKDDLGNLYFTDYNNHCIRKVDIYGVLTTVCGNGYPGSSPDGTPASSAQLTTPYGLAIDHFGNIYVLEHDLNRVRKINTSGIISTIAGTGTAGYSGDGGPATDATFFLPDHMCSDNSGNLFVTDNGNKVIRKISTSGIISTYAGAHSGGSYGASGPATAMAFYNPEGIATDSLGNLFIVDAGGNKVCKVSTSGLLNTIITGMSSPFDIACDNLGNLYLPGYSTNIIQKFDAFGALSTIAGTGTIGFSGDGGDPTLAMLNHPSTICTDNGGIVYFSDNSNYRIRTLSPAGISPISGISSICIETTVPMVDTTTGGVWSSSSPSVATISSTGVVTGIAPGNATISYTISNSCGSVTATKSITVNGISYVPPIAGTDTLSAGATSIFTDSLSSGSWSTSDTSIATINTAGVVTGVAAGTVTINYMVSDSCNSLVVTKVITINPVYPAAVVSPLINSTHNYTIYPNPSNGNINIEQFMAVDGPAYIRVINYLGQTVFDRTLYLARGKTKLDIGDVPTGLYFLEIKDNKDKISNLKLVVMK